MAQDTIVVVNIQMPNGALHGPIQLHPVTNEDQEEMEFVLNQAQNQGSYDTVTQIIHFDALRGIDLYWEGVGARDSFDFETISPGIVMRGTLYWSNPLIWVEETDDLESQCLCQDGFSCLICRLQNRVQEAEALRYEAEQERDIEAVELDESVEEESDLLEELDRLETENELLKDKMKNLKGFVAEVRMENSKLVERNSELHKENIELREQIRQLRYENQKPIEYVHGNISGASRITSNSDSNRATGGPLDYNLNLSHHKQAHRGVIERGIESGGNMDGPQKSRDTTETDGKDGSFHSASVHDRRTTFFSTSRQRGGKCRGDGNPGFHGEPIKRKRADEADKVAEDLELPKKRYEYAMTTNGRLAKDGVTDASGSPTRRGATITKNGTEDSYLLSKYHNSVTQPNNQLVPVEERYSSNTKEITEKRIGMNLSQQIDGEFNDETPKFSCSPVRYPLDKTDKSTNLDQKINGQNLGIEKGAQKKRRYESDDEEEEDHDDFKPDTKRQRRLKTHTSNLGRGAMSAESIRGFASTGRATNNSRSSFLDCLGPATSQDVQSTTNKARIGRSTNNSLAHFLDSNPGAAIPDILQRNASNASTGVQPLATSLSPNAQQPNHASTDGRRSIGWTDRERQAFIGLMNIQVNHTPEEERLHDVHLYEFMSAQLRQRHGINRNPGACKNEWNRRLRAYSGIDERKVKNPRKLATSVQTAGS